MRIWSYFTCNLRNINIKIIIIIAYLIAGYANELKSKLQKLVLSNYIFE